MVDKQDEAGMMLCSYCWQPVDLLPGHGSFHMCGHYVARLENQSCYGAVTGLDSDLKESS